MTSSDIVAKIRAEKNFNIDTLILEASNVEISNNIGLIIPVGTTSERGTSSRTGTIRFNSSDTAFEGYDGDNWGTLGGVKDVAQTTLIRAENFPSANNKQLDFITDDIQRMQIDSNGDLKFGDISNQDIKFSVDYQTGGTQTIIPKTDMTYDLGSSNNSWKNLYLGSNDASNSIFFNDIPVITRDYITEEIKIGNELNKKIIFTTPVEFQITAPTFPVGQAPTIAQTANIGGGFIYDTLIGKQENGIESRKNAFFSQLNVEDTATFKQDIKVNKNKKIIFNNQPGSQSDDLINAKFQSIDVCDNSVFESNLTVLGDLSLNNVNCDIIPKTDMTHYLGNSNNSWDKLYLQKSISPASDSGIYLNGQRIMYMDINGNLKIGTSSGTVSIPGNFSVTGTAGIASTAQNNASIAGGNIFSTVIGIDTANGGQAEGRERALFSSIDVKNSSLFQNEITIFKDIKIKFANQQGTNHTDLIDAAFKTIDVSTNSIFRGDLDICGELNVGQNLTLNNNYGVSGDSLISQGPGVPPIWNPNYKVYGYANLINGIEHNGWNPVNYNAQTTYTMFGSGLNGSLAQGTPEYDFTLNNYTNHMKLLTNKVTFETPRNGLYEIILNFHGYAYGANGFTIYVYILLDDIRIGGYSSGKNDGTGNRVTINGSILKYLNKDQKITFAISTDTDNANNILIYGNFNQTNIFTSIDSTYFYVHNVD